ncbi:MAG: HAMP domain-containing protein [Anaerolineae bacterium]|nr:HAMP domain-containing protein [Anaerolineae bacterium]
MSKVLTSLRTRLLLSHVLILVLTIVVIGVALLFVLHSRPLLTESTSLRLVSILQQLDATEEQGAVIPNAGPTLVQRAALLRLDRRLGTRIIVANGEGIVSFDSRRIYGFGSRLNSEAQPYLPLEESQNNVQFPLVRGVLHNPDNSEWLFVAQAPHPNNPKAQLLYVAIRAPRLLTPLEMLQYYGSDLIAPLVQAALIGLSVAFVMSLIIARSVARPLQDVAAVAEALARGKLDQRAPVRGPGELRLLAETFNRMADEVEATQQAQRDFLANVTHDLRTPLTSIQGFSQAIIEGVAANPNAAQRAAQIIHEEAGRLNRMVQELLDLARIEAGRLNMTRYTVALDSILNAVGENLTPRAAAKGVTLTLELAPIPPIAGDSDRLMQVYTNLVDNAIQHTPPGGRITVRVHPQDSGVLTQVSDTGEGIPAADVPHVFDRFYQVDKSRQREKRDGVGLGLAITKGIVDAHGGRIWVESQEGAGTTFAAWFPALSNDSSTMSRRRGVFKAAIPRPIPE